MTTFFRSRASNVAKVEMTSMTGGSIMATGTMNLGSTRNILFDAIVKELRSWSDIPRRIFMQAHYSGKRIEDIASQSGMDPQEALAILEMHELKLRKALRALRRDL
jgi:hypothetical protein